MTSHQMDPIALAGLAAQMQILTAVLSLRQRLELQAVPPQDYGSKKKVKLFIPVAGYRPWTLLSRSLLC
jgi:hypothetical protein